MSPTLSLPDPSDFHSISGNEKSGLYCLENAGMQAVVTNFGARLVSLVVQDSTGKPTNVVLGFDTLDKYIAANERYFGAIIGRFANRISNAQFTLNGRIYELSPNNGSNTLHGGEAGFHDCLFSARQTALNRLELFYTSPDGEGGFPGTLELRVVYSIRDTGELQIDYTAVTDQSTVINLTHHSYFNLNGAGQESVANHLLQINAELYTPVNAALIPLGWHESVAGTPFDFREKVAIATEIDSSNQQLERANGYDHNFVLRNDPADEITLAASAESPLTGICMDVFTTEPGMQFYSGNFLDGSDRGADGKPFLFRSAFCLEPQHFPDSPNQPGFPSTILNPGEVFNSRTIYKFSAKA